MTIKVNMYRSLCLVMIGLISVAEATVPPIPKGIFSMPAAETNGFPDQILNDPRIVGLDIVDFWADIEATEGVYDWSYMDSELAKAEAHGKQVVLGVVSGGVNVPDWLLANPNVQTFTFIDDNPYHSTYGQPLTMPVFWDPIFLAKKIALIQAAGAHFASHSSVVVVNCSFANSMTADWNIPGEPPDLLNWQQAGYSTDLMVNAGEMIIDATMAAFPNQNVVMGIGRGAGDLDPTSDYLSEAIVDYATTTYGRFITAKFSLAANVDDPAIDTFSLFNWQVLFDQSPTVATQMLWFVSGDSTYRMNGGIPGIPATILLNAVIIGTHFGTQYQEFYEADLEDPTLSATIDTANALLTVTPSPPAAPSNVTGTASDPWTVNLTWLDNSSNNLGYRIESKVGTDGTYGVVTTVGPNATAATVINLLEGTQYYYRLRGFNVGGFSAYSNETSVTTILNAPGTLTAQALSSSQVLVTWTDQSATESGFRIERSPVTDTNYTEVATVGANATSFTDSGLNEATTYWYRVRAYNAYTTSAYATERQVTTLYNIPAAPSGLTITSLQRNNVSLSWGDNSGDELGFKIQRKTGVTGTYATIATTAANATTDTDNTVTDGTLYYYRIAATNTAGDSAFSNEASGTTPLAAPTSATATAVSSSQINLTWVDNSASETGYKVERKTGATGTYTQIAQVGANVQSYSDTNGLAGNTRYYYRVRATNGTIDSAYSNETSALTLLDAPAAPSNLTITFVLSNQVSLSWADNSNNETGFKIQRKTGISGTYVTIWTTASNITSYMDNAVADGTLYYYRICATNATGDSAFSNEASGTTALAKPTSATATAVSSSQINLTWVDNSSSETGYKIERKTGATGTYAQIDQVGTNVQSYSDTNGLVPNTKYYYRIRATNGTIDSDYSNAPSATTLLNAPVPPSNLAITSVVSNQVTLSWSDNSNNETGFKIQRKTGVSGTYATIRTTASNITSYTDSGLADGTLYYYRVCATNATGDSAFSNEASGTTSLAKPTSATATAVSSSQINLTWVDNSASETGYKIERRTGTTGNYAQIVQVGANVQSYSDTNGLSPNTRYYYRVRATNGTIDSDYSNAPFATTLLNAPAAPSNLTITSVLSNQVSLSWSDNSNNETGFKIQRKTGVSGTYVTIWTTAANITSYMDNDTALRDGTLYYYRVSATNATGDSAFSNEASGTTALAQPTSATATAVSSSQINLTWVDNSSSETGYKIERKTGATGTYSQIDQVGANVQSYSDTNGLAQNTRYYYRVRATNGTIDSNYSNEVSALTLVAAPAAPSNLTITSVLSNQVNLSWTDNSNNETGFKIQRKTGVSGTYVTIWTTAANVTSYMDTDTALRDGTLYYYRVSATNTAGDSAFSNEASGTTALAKPTSATATAVSSSQINLSWVDNSSSETGYKIERKTGATGTYAQIDQVGANVQNYSDTNGLAPNTRYYYRIRTTNGTIDSDYSNAPSAVTFQ
jgi:fibronectin type 3 domain-containing protein